MDKSLDEVISERQRSSRGGGAGGRRPRRDNRDNGKDGGRDGGRDRDRNRKYDRDSANLDDEWIHDKYDEDADDARRPARRSRPARYERASPDADLFGRDRDRGTKIRVENLHWDLNEADLTGLFERIGPISRLSIDYDRSGRSTGTAYVTYPDALDARDAVRQFDGANAKGQPIRLTIVPSGPSSKGGRNPFDTAQPPGRSLFDRIEGGRNDASRSQNRERNRSRSPDRKRADFRASVRSDIDRYVPNDKSRTRSGSPRRRGNDRGTGRRRGGGDDRGRDGRKSKLDEHISSADGGRSRPTRDDLDKEMDDYFKSGQTAGVSDNSQSVAIGENVSVPTGSAAVVDDDIDMIE